MDGEPILIYDIECKTLEGKPNPKTDKLVVFGCYSYLTNDYYYLNNIEDIKKVINKHKYLIGFNNLQYDNVVLFNNGFNSMMRQNNYGDANFNYKYNIDLMQIFKLRAGSMKVKKGMLNDLLMSYSLDFISKTIGIVDDNDGKIKNFDYSVLNKEKFTKEDVQYIKEYLKRDIDVTKKMYEWVEEYFDSFKHFVHEEDIINKKYLTTATSVFTYKAICKKLEIDEEYDKGDHQNYGGGYVAYPAGEEFEGDIYCLDFNCIPSDEKIRCLTKGGHGFLKPIQKIKEGQKVLSLNGETNTVEMIKEQYLDGELIEIELENGKVLRCTDNHIVPVYRDEALIDIEAKDIVDTDELITSQTKRGKNNPNYSDALKKYKCEICGQEFYNYQSQSHKGCSKECINKLRSINASKTNLGLTKESSYHLMKMSIERKGKKRSQHICFNIAEANRIKNQNNYSGSKYELDGVHFKSYAEFVVAKAFKRDDIKWIYEPKVFKLKNQMVYTPDFYLPEIDKWVEVKGLTGISNGKPKEKFKQFFKEHRNAVLIKQDDINKFKEVLYGKN